MLGHAQLLSLRVGSTADLFVCRLLEGWHFFIIQLLRLLRVGEYVPIHFITGSVLVRTLPCHDQFRSSILASCHQVPTWACTVVCQAVALLHALEPQAL